MKVIFHPEAYEEMLESARFFEEKSAGLGSDLIAAIQSATHRLKKFPESGVVEQGMIRKCLVPGFPFTLLYEPNPRSHLYCCRYASASAPWLLDKASEVTTD